jgi:hypothetical protein
VPNFQSLGLSGPSVIVPGFEPGAGLMGWSHVVEVIRASEFEGVHVLGNPAIAHAIDQMLADDATPTRSLPDLKAPPG